MLTKRKRGKTWHVRGTVKVGRETRDVPEHATGLRDAALADAYLARLERQIQEEILYGAAGRARRVSFAEAGQVYIDRPEGLHPNDVWRIGELNDILGSYPIADVLEGWSLFKRRRCTGLAPATVNRFRDALQAALNYAAVELGYAAPRVPRIKFSNARIRWLPDSQADSQAERLAASYVAHVQPIVLTYRYQGCRTQEALQLQISNIDLRRETIFFERTKNGAARTVKMHAKVAEALEALMKARGNPDLGHVFLNRLGRPYADTRDYKLPGGNPLRQAHATAVARARIRPNGGPDFTLHDWRHHWASHCVMAGIDLPTIQRLGGWKSLRMVERYAAVSTEHMDAAVAKLR